MSAQAHPFRCERTELLAVRLEFQPGPAPDDGFENIEHVAGSVSEVPQDGKGRLVITITRGKAIIERELT